MKDKKILSQQTFDYQATTYDTTSNSQHARTLYPWVLDQIIHHYASEILDLGCGTGELLAHVYA